MQNFNCSSKSEKEKKIFVCKKEINIAQLCHKLPIEFQKLLEYSKQLKFNEKPNYDFFINLFRMRISFLGFDDDDIFEWSNWPIEKFIIDKISPKNKKKKNYF